MMLFTFSCWFFNPAFPLSNRRAGNKRRVDRLDNTFPAGTKPPAPVSHWKRYNKGNADVKIPPDKGKRRLVCRVVFRLSNLAA
ncbi:hypothetical protein CYK00_08260 [Neisseria sicca]|uniref:Uncharacterized protein n=1 Tax=Neisseria sicca TaxID=490 RepID=A0A2I1XBC2_NEISI|nr:hypothetical protein CYK00_08260 [Neisseria sicca]